MWNMLKSSWAYRGFIFGSVKREFQSRYRNSMLGATWVILQPLAKILVFTLVFSQVMRGRLPGVDSSFGYSIFLCAGLLTWGLFVDLLSRSQNMFPDNANLLKKINFPHICLPIIVSVNACAGFAITISLFAVFLLLSGNFHGLAFLAIVPVLLLQILFSIGLGMVIGVLNVFFRDIGQLFGIVLQFWFWVTPIVYPLASLPDWAQRIVMLNPMTPLVEAYQGIFVQGALPLWASLWPTAALACVLCFLGMRLFQKRAGEIVDEL